MRTIHCRTTRRFLNASTSVTTLLSRYHDTATVDRTLLATERRNLELYGYGVKSFTLSAIETAIALTEGRISAEETRPIITIGQEMLSHPVDLLDGVEETLAELCAGDHRLLLIAKGDLHAISSGKYLNPA
jgi:putative hydrolase of the HAD superfamily